MSAYIIFLFSWISDETGYELEGRNSVLGKGRNFISPGRYYQTDISLHTASYPVSAWTLFLWVKLPNFDTDEWTSLQSHDQ
jgi:hypothetical protein